MMIEEFEQRTGYFPSSAEYKAIEAAYMEFDGDKDEFCKAYKKNANDIAARLSAHYTTIYKELQRGATGELDANQREGYSAELAERRLRESFKRRGKKSVATLAQ